ncbi:hypothetical protein B0A54_05758 [Friedmanniomyces endolithicus]|uniref:Uncharacterized protein n=1 Tax=Friedmanniomyces endolithicus TaxID=329885 RepID=A0A4U0V3Y3_9PEZI|nr:hypothetical protein LTS09_012401 [Friedmanniomyces endolithicus]TKA43277.1 hypothetical protein B0A54_05758 [Friedmanniomyces endolithicus]
MPRIFIARTWRIPPIIIALIVIEFPLTVACLALYGIADPDTYRTKLWQNGYDKGFNSAPNSILYNYANYKPAYTPMIWSSQMVQFNIAIAVLSMFLLLAKATLYLLHIYLPVISAFISIVEVAIYAVSLKSQSTPDHSDPAHIISGLPWYLSKGCSYADPANYGFCMQARAVYAVTCVMIALFSCYFIWSVYSMWPTAAERAERKAHKQSDIELKRVNEYSPDNELTREEIWERNRQMFLNLPKTPNTPGFGGSGGGMNPMTPRTVAFTQLNGGAGPSKGMGMPSTRQQLRDRFGGGGDGRVPDAR